MNLNFDINFSDLNSLEGVRKIDKIFLDYLGEKNQTLYNNLLQHRTLKSVDSDFLIELAPYFDDFIAELFFIETENFALKNKQKNFDIIYECRRRFVQRVFKNYDIHKKDKIDFPKISQELTKLLGKITEKIFAEHVINWLKEPIKFKLELELASCYACYMALNNSSLPLFNIPRIINEHNLINDGKIQILAENIYIGFDYRDSSINSNNAIFDAKYCIYCHSQNKDSCRTGLPIPDVKNSTNQEEKLKNQKHGCPLDQKISEMNKLFAMGFNIGSLGVILIDNPLVAATGHRICNDCMKSCIFQKQDPVNIPLIESKILDNVLSFPYGLEIYLLMTKWNPLNILLPLPLEPTNYNVLVVGLGPSGFALSHYLLKEGHNVTAIDGLKIQPLDFDITKPIKDWSKLKVPLSQRLPQGFGGVAEYGITNRWDKNSLTLIRLILERQNNFKMIGGIRLGSNITADQVLEFGYDHIALCLGAGRPRYINSDSYFFKGVKTAADFLMNLQQGGSYLKNSNSNLLLRMPAIVIGCGLTAIDSGVEIIHYYPNQVEKFLSSYEQNMIDLFNLNDEDKIIAEEFISHGKLFRKAKSDNEKLEIIKSLGGVSICYRNNICESPAYKRNHEEIEHAKAIGVKFIENISPSEIKADEYDYVNQIQFLDSKGTIIEIEARTVLVAIGTEETSFEAVVGLNDNSKFSHFGDCNQKYSGSVVKALASAKNGYKEITRKLMQNAPSINFLDINKILHSTIDLVKEISPNIIEFVIKSPIAARNYQPGQIFRFQNLATSIGKTTKSLALSPYEVDPERGLISFIILKTGNSTKLCAGLKNNEEVVLMGPTGSRTKILPTRRVVLIGHGVRNMALLPIAKWLKKQGSEIIFFANYEKKTDIFYAEKIETFADKIIWSALDELPECNRKQDIAIKSDLINSLSHHTEIWHNTGDALCYVPDKLMHKIKLFGNSNFICNLLSPMQCMMHGICGQCIQKVDDNSYVFACACSEYDIKNFNPKILSDRLKQNSLLEKIGN